MANKNPEVLAAWAEVDTATTAAGARVQVLIDEIEALKTDDGITAEQTDGFIARLNTHVAWLNGLGHNANQPIPEPPPETPIPGANQ